MIRLVKGVLGGLLICACVSACSDDTMEGEGNEGLKENANPAYLTISFKASSASDSRSVDSRTDTEANTGDNHGDAEDSGHHEVGKEAENAVKTALVIAHPTTTNVAFAKLYSVTTALNPTDKEGDTNNKYFYVSESGIATSSDNATPIELAIGEYKLLVVVNPPAELYKDAFEGNELSTTVLAKVKALYEKALDGNYEVKDVTNYLAGPATGEEPKYFMMANKAEKTVKLEEDDTPDSPEHVTVVVERAASKITYRQLATDNKYPVTIETQRKAETIDAAIKVNDEWTYAKLNLASDLQNTEGVSYNNDLAVLYQEVEDADGNKTTTVTVYRRTDTPRTVKDENDSDVEAYECVGPLTAVKAETFTTETDADKKAGYFVVEDAAFGEDGTLKTDYDLLRSLNISYDAAATERSTYYVTIEGYALTNLAKSVNYVRQTVEYSGTDGLPFGTVEDKYLWTPNWAAKNAVDFSATDFKEADFNTSAEGWYYNPLHKVAEETHVLQLPTDNNTNFSVSTEGGSVQYFKLMPSVQTTLDKEHSNADNADVPAIGSLLGYCLENSTDITHQTHGLSTGIVFVASITDEDGNTPTLYRFNGYVYESLAAIQRAYGKAALAKNDTEELIFQTLVDNEQSATKEQLAHYGIVKYEGGKCYYYTTEIKHFDNGDNSNMGYMEYAIMRNNIYSLAIKGIRFIGDPFLEPVPGKTNESGKAALDIEVQIVPWIVRYNDIEF